MKATEILQLINAGYTKAEIEAMELPETAAAPDPIPEPVPEAEPKPTPEVKPEASAPAEQSAIDKLTAEVTRLTALVQKSNMLQAEQPALTPPKPEDILASIIYPSHKG